jgi:hypothetical protein
VVDSLYLKRVDDEEEEEEEEEEKKKKKKIRVSRCTSIKDQSPYGLNPDQRRVHKRS